MVKGIVVRADHLGRDNIPQKMYKILGIKPGDTLDIYIENGKICIAPVKLQCVFCGCEDEEKLLKIDGLYICPDCVLKIVKKYE